MNDLDYEFHAERYKDLLASPNEETRAAGEVRALEDHQLAVRTELQNFTSDVIGTGQKLLNSKAQQYFFYGVGRRLRMVLAAYCGVFDTVEADRKEPLPLTEMAAVSRDLNVIYINIRGILDNYAWSVYHEKGMSKTEKLKDTEVGLFIKAFRNNAHLKNLKAMLDTNMDWNTDLNRAVIRRLIGCRFMYLRRS
jgi:hypothetical protein